MSERNLCIGMVCVHIFSCCFLFIIFYIYENALQLQPFQHYRCAMIIHIRIHACALCLLVLLFILHLKSLDLTFFSFSLNICNVYYVSLVSVRFESGLKNVIENWKAIHSHLRSLLASHSTVMENKDARECVFKNICKWAAYAIRSKRSMHGSYFTCAKNEKDASFFECFIRIYSFHSHILGLMCFVIFSYCNFLRSRFVL